MNPNLKTAMLLLLSVTAPGCIAEKMKQTPPIFPQPLVPGDTIAFVAPAGRLDRTRMERARQRLETMGFHVRVPDDLYRTRGYLAGDDATRAAELMAAFADPQVKAIFPGTGNYGTTRILDRLDYDVIRQNPKIFVGFSDITGLHLAIGRKTGLVTFHSPNPMYGLGSESDLSDFSAHYFWRALLRSEYPTTASSPRTKRAKGHPFNNHESATQDTQSTSLGTDLAAPGGYAYILPPTVSPLEVLVPGTARGRLTGGNLSLVIALMGTEYEIQTAGRILFLEDVSERPYRIDRYLSQLRLAGKLDAAAGILLGKFSRCEPKPDEKSLTLAQVFDDYFGSLSVPVITNFPAGHAAQNATLPMNALVEIAATASSAPTIKLLEDPVNLAGQAPK